MANDNETVEQIYAEAMETTGVFPSRQTYAKRYLAAHERKLAAKDEEIAKLKACLAGDCERMRLCAEPCAECHIERINERNEIIKELAEALHGMEEVLQKVRKSAWWMDARFDEIMAVNNVMTKADAAFAKAQEVVNG